MNILPLVKTQKLHTAFLAGLGIRSSARVAGVNRKTAYRYFIDSGAAHLCKCGKSVLHRGWCSYRVSQSPKRQMFLVKKFGAGHVASQTWFRLQLDIAASLTQLAPLEDLRPYKAAALQRRISRADPDLKRHFDAYGTQHGWEYGKDGLASHVAVSAESPSTPFALLKALEKLNPVVQKFVLTIIEGADVQSAADEAGLPESSVQLVMPRLKIFLEPYLRA